MVSSNVPTSRHHGAPKHGDALLAGLIRCRRCGRKLTLRYSGTKHHIPRYSCSRGWMDNGEPRCIAFGGLRVDDAIEEALLSVVGPGAIAAAIGCGAGSRSATGSGARCARPRSRSGALRGRPRLPAIRCRRSGQPAGDRRTGGALEQGARACGGGRGQDRGARCGHARCRHRSCIARYAGVGPQDRLVRADDRRTAEEAHRPHSHPGGRRRYRRRSSRDRPHRPLDRRPAQRDAPAQAPPRPAQQHLS